MTIPRWAVYDPELQEAWELFGHFCWFAHRCRRGRWWLKIPKCISQMDQPVGFYVTDRIYR